MADSKCVHFLELKCVCGFMYVYLCLPLRVDVYLAFYTYVGLWMICGSNWVLVSWRESVANQKSAYSAVT